MICSKRAVGLQHRYNHTLLAPQTSIVAHQPPNSPRSMQIVRARCGHFKINDVGDTLKVHSSRHGIRRQYNVNRIFKVGFPPRSPSSSPVCGSVHNWRGRAWNILNKVKNFLTWKEWSRWYCSIWVARAVPTLWLLTIDPKTQLSRRLPFPPLGCEVPPSQLLSALAATEPGHSRNHKRNPKGFTVLAQEEFTRAAAWCWTLGATRCLEIGIALITFWVSLEAVKGKEKWELGDGSG